MSKPTDYNVTAILSRLTEMAYVFEESALAEVLLEASKALKGEYERADLAEKRLETIKRDVELTPMTPNPQDPGAFVLGRDGEKALFNY